MTCFFSALFVGLCYFSSQLSNDIENAAVRIHNIVGYHFSVSTASIFSVLLSMLQVYDFLVKKAPWPTNFSIAVVMTTLSKLYFVGVDYDFFSPPLFSSDWALIVITTCLAQCFVAFEIYQQDEMGKFLSLRMLTIFMACSATNGFGLLCITKRRDLGGLLYIPLFVVIYFLAAQWVYALFSSRDDGTYREAKLINITILCGAFVLPNFCHTAARVVLYSLECVNGYCSVSDAMLHPTIFIIIYIAPTFVYGVAALLLRRNPTPTTDHLALELRDWSDSSQITNELTDGHKEDTLDNEIVRMTFGNPSHCLTATDFLEKDVEEHFVSREDNSMVRNYIEGLHAHVK